MDDFKKIFSWEISKELLYYVLDDQVSDRLVCELIWERLFYKKESRSETWVASTNTPYYWSSAYIQAPLIISERKASVHLTRSINKNYKQGLKDFLGFNGYKISELYPRRTRRATAVNWLIYWARESDYLINDHGKCPKLLEVPKNPVLGHPGDLPIN